MVEYGADLHTMDHGSGFPTNTSKDAHPNNEQYAHSEWNLTNLPVVGTSCKKLKIRQRVLCHFNITTAAQLYPEAH